MTDLERLDDVQIAFLERVQSGRGLSHATRVEDRARQKCRRAGLVEVLKSPRRWALTELGARALAAKSREVG